MKYEIWLQGGPPTDFQQLFVTGSQERLSDIEKIQHVLPRQATLQLVVTTPAARGLRVHACVDPHHPFPSDEFTVPIASEPFEPPLNNVTADIAYLGDMSVESTADGSSIALEIQEQFGEMHLNPRMIIFVSTDDYCEGCAGWKVFIGMDVKHVNP